MKDKRLLIIFITVFIDLVGFGIIIPMNPYLAKTFGATPLQIGLLMSIYSLMQFVFAPIWGQLSDRHGRRPIILISLFGVGLCHLGFAFGTSLTALMIARGLAGVFGGNISAAMAYIADITEAKDRSKSMGLIGAAFGLGFTLGPFIGAVTSLWSDMPGFPAIIAGGICLINALVAVKYLPESNVNRTALTESRSHNVRWRNLWNVLTRPTLNVLMLVSFLSAFGMANIEAPLFLLMDQRFGWTMTQASFGFAYVGIVLVFTQGYLIRKLMPRMGERNVLMLGLLLAGFGMIIMGVAPTVMLVALGVTLLGLGNGMVNPSLNGSISLLSGKDEQGKNLGVSQSLSSMARIVGPAMGGYLFAMMMSSPFVAGGVASLLGLVLAVMIRKSLPMAGHG